MAPSNALYQNLISQPGRLAAPRPRAGFVAPQGNLPAQVQFGSLNPKALNQNAFTGATVGNPFGTLPHPEAAPEFRPPEPPPGGPAAVSLAPFLHTAQGGAPTPTLAGPFPGQFPGQGQPASTGATPGPTQPQLTTSSGPPQQVSSTPTPYAAQPGISGIQPPQLTTGIHLAPLPPGPGVTDIIGAAPPNALLTTLLALAAQQGQKVNQSSGGGNTSLRYA